MLPIFTEFALITLAAWAAGAAAWAAGRRLRRGLPHRAADLSFYGALALFVATFTVLAVLRHLALNSHAYDLAVYDQVVWNLSRRRWFETSLEYYFYNFLGDHLSLALPFLASLYWLYPDPSLLVALQRWASTGAAGRGYPWGRAAALPSSWGRWTCGEALPGGLPSATITLKLQEHVAGVIPNPGVMAQVETTCATTPPPVEHYSEIARGVGP